MDFEDRKAIAPPLEWAFFSGREAYDMEGFGEQDVQRLFDWRDGKIEVNTLDKARLEFLETLIVRF